MTTLLENGEWLTSIPKWNGYGLMKRNLNYAGFSEPEIVCFCNGKVERLGCEGLFDFSELNDSEFYSKRVDIS